jgi:osmotically-inducible protein OsmY
MKHRSLVWLAGIVAMAAISACASTNAGLTTEIKNKLAADSTVQARDISVDSDRGVVTLRGTVESQPAKDRAIQIARETKGVVNVRDMLAVRTETGSVETPDAMRTVPHGATADTSTTAGGPAPGAVEGATDDAAITTSVKQALLKDPMLRGVQVEVDTRAGVVYLTGDVRSDKVKQQLIKVAKETSGVKDVQANVRLVSG